MNILKSLKEQVNTVLPSIIFIVLVSISFIGFVLFLHFNNNISLHTLTSDIATVSNEEIYVGLLSQIGIFFWAASMAICFFVTALIWKKQELKKVALFFLFSGFITLLLAFDDIFLLHEDVFPLLGIPQKVVFLSYALIMLLYGLKFYSILLKSNYLLLIMAIGFFGLSIFVDLFIHSTSEYINSLLEDGAKFIGIVSWLMYYFITGKKTLQMMEQ